MIMMMMMMIIIIIVVENIPVQFEFVFWLDSLEQNNSKKKKEVKCRINKREPKTFQNSTND